MDTVFELVCVTYISLSVLATVSDALPESTAALVVFACISGYGGDVAVGCLVWMLLGICFWCDLVVLPIFSYDFWVRDLIRNSVCDPNILAIRQQPGKGSEMVSDIFETQSLLYRPNVWSFHVFHW